MKKKKYIRLIHIFLVPLGFMFSQCMHSDNTGTDPRGPEYSGSEACMKCHSSIYTNSLHSAHFLTSRAATSATVHGSFKPDSNTVMYNDSVKVVMEKQAGGLFQALYKNGRLSNKQRFDIIFGSNRGETYLYWQGSEVKQLPVSYYLTLHEWANSPGGYYNDSVNFSRIIHARCFECHASFIKSVGQPTGPDGQSDSLDRSSMILGIDCERCHGPGAAHVDFHTQNPGVKQPAIISQFSKLTRQQRIDFCSVCHAGITGVMTKSTFFFKPGDTLAMYTSGQLFHAYQDAASVDVHGNQVKLLTSSKCFFSSKIECKTCHSMHSDAAKSLAAWSNKCLTCHSTANHNFCKIAEQVGPAIKTDCIDCHMPIRSSKTVVISASGKPNNPPFLARTHLIAIYPDETRKILAMLSAKAKP